jgi:hypothetical protein
MPLVRALTAYFARDVSAFRTSLEEIDRAYETRPHAPGEPSIRWRFCRELAHFAPKERNLDMLPTILQEDFAFDSDFDRIVDNLKHGRGDLTRRSEILKIVDESRYVSPVPPGETWPHMHDLDLRR